MLPHPTRITTVDMPSLTAWNLHGLGRFRQGSKTYGKTTSYPAVWFNAHASWIKKVK
jgi:hypothetical protein